MCQGSRYGVLVECLALSGCIEGKRISSSFMPRLQSAAFADLVELFRQLLAQLPGKRRGNNTRYQMEDAALSAFSVFFTQSPSFLAFQRSMQDTQGRDNTQSLLGVYQIPCDNHIRDLLDIVPPEPLFPLFGDILEVLHDLGYPEPFRSINGNPLIPLDGTQYHASKSIHCDQYSQTQHRNGQITYSHTVITPMIAAPDSNTVIPLEPEFNLPQDGHEKQDCENAAAKLLASPVWFASSGTGRHDSAATGQTHRNQHLPVRQSVPFA